MSDNLTKLAELVERHRDGSLDAAGVAALDRLLADPQQARIAVGQLRLAALVAGAQGAMQPELGARTRALVDASRGSRQLRVVASVRQRLARKNRQQVHRRWVTLASAACLLVCLFVVVELKRNPTSDTVPVPVQAVNQGLLLSNGTQLHPGETLTTVAAQSLVLADGSRFDVGAGTRLTWDAADRARWHLADGELSVAAAHQPPTHPLTVTVPEGEVAVIGTRFTLSVAAGRSTWLSVSEGLVQARRASAEWVPVPEGQALNLSDPVAQPQVRDSSNGVAATAQLDARIVLAPLARSRLGLVLNATNDALGRSLARPLAEAIRELGVGVLRYSAPGRWSVPPYAVATPTAFGRGEQDAGFDSEGRRQERFIDADAFLTLAGETTTAACAQVPTRTGMTPAQSDLTREQLIADASAWVAHAHGRIAVWEIGQETSHHFHAAAGQTPAEYATDLRDFSRAMKAVDPAIRIGATSDWSPERVDALLEKARGDLDLIVVRHFDWGNRASFQAKPVEPWEINMITQRLDALPASERDRIRIAVSECLVQGEADHPQRGDTWHCLAGFATVGWMLSQPRIDFVAQRAAHWDDDPQHTASALNLDNHLAPPGRMLAIWGEHLAGNLVRISSTQPGLELFARVHGGQTTLFLVNKLEQAQALHVVAATPLRGVARCRRFQGRSADDLAPTWGEVPPPTLSADGLHTVLPPFSLSVVDIR